MIGARQADETVEQDFRRRFPQEAALYVSPSGEPEARVVRIDPG